MSTPVAADPFADVVGQDDAVAVLRAALRAPVHAYLLVGPPGSGRRAAARAFAGELLAEDALAAGDDAAVERHRRLARLEAHPDLEVVEREGASIDAEQARAIVRSAMRSPVEGRRKVLVLTEFHLAGAVAPMLLKTIEEPPPGVVFVVLADVLAPDLQTIASRCVVVRFAPLHPDVVATALVADGVAPDVARVAADASGGDLGRAAVLATDPALAARAAWWSSLPDRLDGTGRTVVALVGELLAALDDAVAPLVARQEAELAEIAEREQQYGLRGGSRRTIDARHKREVRRFRRDELRFGLGLLARTLRDGMLGATAGAATPAGAARVRARLGAIDAVHRTAVALDRNPSERLQLERLLLAVGPTG